MVLEKASAEGIQSPYQQSFHVSNA